MTTNCWEERREGEGPAACSPKAHCEKKELRSMPTRENPEHKSDGDTSVADDTSAGTIPQSPLSVVTSLIPFSRSLRSSTRFWRNCFPISLVHVRQLIRPFPPPRTSLTGRCRAKPTVDETCTRQSYTCIPSGAASTPSAKAERKGRNRC
jgi:hypothetical protein